MTQRNPGGFVTNNTPVSNSYYFSGSSYLTLPGAAQYAITTSTTPFTIELWLKVNASGGVIFTEQYTGSTNTVAIACSLSTGTDVSANTGLYPAFGWWNGSAWTTAAVSTTQVVLNRWTHIAFVFTGSTSKVYLNGVDVTKPSTPTPATTWGVTNTNGDAWYISRAWGGATNFITGFINNFRFVRGTAVYTANFPVPYNLTAITNTSLLLAQTSLIKDTSSYNAAITNTAAVTPVADIPFVQTLPYNPALGAATPGVWTISQAAAAAAQRSWNMYDPFFNLNTAVVHGNGANGANNNTFLDSSSNNYTVTKSGNSPQGTFSPFSRAPGSWGLYLGGVGNYVVTNTAAFSTTQTTFTVECWMYMTATPGANPTIVGDMQPASTANNWSFGPNSTNKLDFYWWTGSTNHAIGTTTMALGVWYHIAVSVNANAIKMFINGIQETLTGTTTLTNRAGTTSTIAVGQAQSSSFYFTGYISNLSILDGTAKYSANFTPPTSGLPTNTTNQVFLFGGYNRIYDANTATTAKTLTITGTGVKAVPYSPFYAPTAYTPDANSGSVYLDGSSDYLTVTGNSNLAFGTNNFTIELFVYITAFPAQEIIFDARPSGTTSGAYPTIYLGGGTSRYTYYVSGADRIASDGFYTFNSWTHIVVSRVSGTTRMFIDGVQQTGTYTDGTTYLNGTSRPVIGCAGDTIGNAPWFGYISNVRVLNGTGVTSVTVPTAPLTPVANTQLLLSGTNASVIDNTGNLVMETTGTAAISTSQSKYGGSALSIPASSSIAIYTPFVKGASVVPVLGDFTAECWFYVSSFSGDPNLIFLNGNASSYAALRLQLNNTTATGSIQLFMSSTGAAWAISAATPNSLVTVGNWYHVAVVRSGGVVSLYLNGVVYIASTSLAATTALLAGTDSRLGDIPTVANSSPMFINDFRITTAARYQGGFTPPTSTLQNQ